MPNHISAIKLPNGDVYQIKDNGALQLTGGQVTGPVNFGDSVYINDLNAGTLIVTGNAAFTNNIQANTINGVEVGLNPKFTDTWNKVSTTQDGYVTKLPGGTTSFLRGDGSWATPPDTTYVFDGTYNSSTNKAATVNTVTNAINNLDGNLNNTTPGVGKTLIAFGQTNGKVSATFGDISITKSQVSDFPTSMPASDVPAWAKENEKPSYHLDEIQPLLTKTYTEIIATANDAANAWFFFGSIRPTSWQAVWSIRYRIKGNVPNQVGYDQQAEVTISGSYDALRTYASYNKVNANLSAYYHELYRLKQAGFNSGYGHLLGVRLQSSTNPTNANYKRTFDIEILELKNCTFTFFDNFKLYNTTDISWSGTTNYTGYSEINYCSNGLQEVGDANDVNYYNRENYASRTTSAALYRNQLCLTKSNGTLVPVNTVNNSIATNKTLTMDTFDPFGEIFYWSSTSTYSAGGNVGNSALYRQYLCDLRYSFNCGGYNVASTLIARKPLYLVAVPQDDGTAELYAEPLSMQLPSSVDNLIYIYLGRVYEDTYPYRLVLSLNHPIYEYRDGAVRLYNGLKSKAAVSEGTDVSLVTTGEKYLWNNGVTGIKGDKESSYRTGEVNLTAANIGAVNLAGDTMTGNLIVPKTRIANTYYGVSFGRTTGTPVETILYTGIKWESSRHMPIVHITGYAYGLQSPVEFKIGFYIYQNKIGYCGVTNMGSWAPNVYLFKYTRDELEYVAVGLAGSCYYLQLSADIQDEMGKFSYINIDSSAWSWSFLTSAGTIPDPDGGTTCIQVPYKANILKPANATHADEATKATQDADGNVIKNTYLKLSGGTMTGVLTTKANLYTDAYNSGALNLKNSNIDGVNSIYTADTSENAAEGIHFYRDSTHVDSLYAKSGVLYFTPNRALGSAGTDYSIYHSGITTFDGNATSATKLAQVTDVTSLNDFIDSTCLIYTAKGGSNTIANKPSGVDAFGALSLKTAQGYQGQLLMSSNKSTGLYWRTGIISSNAISTNWLKVLDSNNYTDYTVTKNGTGASGTWGINVSGTAAKLSPLSSSDNASSTSTWRSVWMSYNDGTTGRPALSSVLQYQTSSNTLKSSHFLAEHITNGKNEFQIKYGSTHDVSFMIGNGNKNYGIWDAKGGATGTGQWMIFADENHNVTVNGNATSATKATQDESGNNIKTNYASSLSVDGTTFTLKSKSGASLSTIALTSDNIPSLNASKITDGILPVARGGTGETSFSAGYLLYTPTTGSIKSTKFMHLNYKAGTTSTLGYEELILGNTTTEGTADNAFGRIGFYSAKTKGSYITAANTTNSSWYDHVLPASAGWLVTGGSYDRATGAATGVGSDTIPVYVSTAGRATAITKVDVAHGGTGATSFTANSLIMSGTSTTAALTTRAISTSITTDNSTNIPTESAVKTYVDNQIATIQGTVQGGYVTIAGNAQEVTGRKTLSNLAGASFKPAESSASCDISYNQGLGALVFSFTK